MGIGQNNIGARIHKAFVQVGDTVWVLGVPQLWRVA